MPLHSYQMIDTGNLTHAEITQMKRDLSKSDNLSCDEIVSLTKVRKKGVSVSLSKDAISKLDNLANEINASRSYIVETLINAALTKVD
ncbi:ribbon-helix-helix domain-containing protein [Shewanella sairae]|uniref:ribbon-helix-helix domain-containing protein n=1 Tax=Shewanella sairae TaxID=190310 RepID=UPI00200CAB94|nr:ribbon-helix-helix domain-containing protein [Shewanella sairae]MCL1132533.1 ribbon-helix-helix domain-containing protein [Shewanella sairae]